MRFRHTVPFWVSSFALMTALVVEPTAIMAQTKTEAKEAESESKKDDSKSDKDEKDSKGKDKKSKEKKEKEEPKVAVHKLALSGNYVDVVQPISFDPTMLLLGSTPAKQKSFYRLCTYLQELADDEDTENVVFDLSANSLSMNSAQLDEFTRRMAKLRDAGKKTIAWVELASSDQLAIAATCDEVIMADFGQIDFPSTMMQAMYYKDAMDLVGVKASVVRAGDFKGAVEPYTNAVMSRHLRGHYEAMLKTMNDAKVDRIAKGRGLKRADVRKLQKQRVLTPQEALSHGLVDRLAPYGSMKKTIDDSIGKATDWTTPKTKKKRQVSFFELMGRIMSGPSAKSSRVKKDSIAVLHLSGPIVTGKSSSGGSIVSGPTVSLINKIRDESKFKAVVVRINSPGGSAMASEEVRQALKNMADKKPTIVSMGSMAASGGYWISCIDAPIYAEKATLTGSIGVFSMKLGMGTLMRRVGVHIETLALDDSASIFAVDREWNDEDKVTMMKMIDTVYDRFLKLVSESRGIEVEKLKSLAGGRVWSGIQAKENGLVDELGGVDECLRVVAKKAKLKEYDVVHRSTGRSAINLLELLGETDEEEIRSRLSDVRNVPVNWVYEALKQHGLLSTTTHVLLRDALGKRSTPTIWLMHPAEIQIRN